MPTYTLNGIVLRRKDFAEADKILTLITREKGKIDVIARSARKPGAKLSSLTEGLAMSQFQLAVGRTFDIVTQVVPIHSYLGLRSDLKRLSFALYWCELLDSLVHEGEPNEALFELTEFVLTQLEHSPNPEIALRWGEFHLIGNLGYEPMVDVCAQCEKVPTGLWAGFSPSVGGLLCARCGAQTRDSLRIPLEALPEIRDLLRSDRPSDEILQIGNIARITRSFWRHLLGHDLKSAAFLDELLSEPTL
jgi:DNA repair protein RecO (recombination protein O)